jgi:hypothetical protein
MDEIEILAFRADTKASKGLTAKHIADAAALYDADKNPAPLVFGHPVNDSPALGLVSGARAAGNDLFLKLKNVADTVKTAVKERRILGRSIAFWDPDHPSNPHPGKYSIRHFGLLGGMAPAIPGMPALKFSADEGALEAEDDAAPDAAVVFSVEAGTPVQKIIEEPKPGPKEPVMEFSQEQFDAEKKAREDAERERDELKTANEKRDREFAAAEAARRKGEDETVLTAAVEAGKVLPAEKDDLVKLFEALPTKALTFSAGELEPRQALAKFLDGLPKRGPAKGEKPRSPTEEFSADDAKEKAEKALAETNAGMTTAWKPPQTQATQH